MVDLDLSGRRQKYCDVASPYITRTLIFASLKLLYICLLKQGIVSGGVASSPEKWNHRKALGLQFTERMRGWTTTNGKVFIKIGNVMKIIKV